MISNLLRYSQRPIRSLKMLGSLMLRDTSMLIEHGWPQSYIAGSPVDLNGAPVPWIPYSMTEFLSKRCHSELRMYEYGSGYSTLYFSNIFAEVRAVECCPAWHRRISRQLPENASVSLVLEDVNGAYARSILECESSFDVVLIDGVDRVNCFERCLPVLNDGGVVVLDDSDRGEYRGIFVRASELGFRHLDFSGMKPCSTRYYRSTLFYRPENCVGL